MIVLFVCYANLNRSPRAEMVCKQLLEEKGAAQLLDVSSAGTHASKAMAQFMGAEDFERRFKVPEPRQLTQEMLDSADIIVALDLSVGTNILGNFPKVPIEKIIDLDIPDLYSVARENVDELFRILETKLQPLVDSWIEKTRTELQ